MFQTYAAYSKRASHNRLDPPSVYALPPTEHVFRNMLRLIACIREPPFSILAPLRELELSKCLLDLEQVASIAHSLGSSNTLVEEVVVSGFTFMRVDHHIKKIEVWREREDSNGNKRMYRIDEKRKELSYHKCHGFGMRLDVTMLMRRSKVELSPVWKQTQLDADSQGMKNKFEWLAPTQQERRFVLALLTHNRSLQELSLCGHKVQSGQRYPYLAQMKVSNGEVDTLFQQNLSLPLLHTIDVSYNNLGDACCTSIVHTASGHRQLKHLDLRGNNVTHLFLSALKAIRACPVAVLHLADNDLRDSDTSNAAVIEFAAVLRRIPTLKTLSIGMAHPPAKIGRTLLEKAGFGLALDVTAVATGPVGPFLALGLGVVYMLPESEDQAKPKPWTREFNLQEVRGSSQGTTQVDAQSWSIRDLKAALIALGWIESQLPPEKDELVAMMEEAAIPGTTKLNFSQVGMDNVFCTVLGEMLLDNMALVELDLSHNATLSAVGLVRLCNSLQHHKSGVHALTSFSLEGNSGLGPQFGATFSDVLQHNTALRKVNLASCGLLETGLMSIANGMHKNTAVTELNVGDNQPSWISYARSSLKELVTKRELRVQGNIPLTLLGF